MLVQVRPRPRRVDPARRGKSPFKNLKKGSGGELGGLEEAMESVMIGEE